MEVSHSGILVQNQTRKVKIKSRLNVLYLFINYIITVKIEFFLNAIFFELKKKKNWPVKYRRPDSYTANNRLKNILAKM